MAEEPIKEIDALTDRIGEAIKEGAPAEDIMQVS